MQYEKISGKNKSKLQTKVSDDDAEIRDKKLKMYPSNELEKQGIAKKDNDNEKSKRYGDSYIRQKASKYIPDDHDEKWKLKKPPPQVKGFAEHVSKKHHLDHEQVP